MKLAVYRTKKDREAAAQAFGRFLEEREAEKQASVDAEVARLKSLADVRRWQRDVRRRLGVYDGSPVQAAVRQRDLRRGRELLDVPSRLRLPERPDLLTARRLRNHQQLRTHRRARLLRLGPAAVLRRGPDHRRRLPRELRLVAARQQLRLWLHGR